eukprot:CAMPEP_0197452668 /NCGR_PEP_ID=MMETSP1175-20131217/32665_1 /TAXON_ID=1003142 /ORGANISM="Triceratium dubium, Strain CCMP147" /LENGTH=91 /DNA_ID=CAMNT_0042985735 /DNA_START=16 /DNA_END=287 /DNA_ORIENTATION=+
MNTVPMLDLKSTLHNGPEEYYEDNEDNSDNSDENEDDDIGAWGEVEAMRSGHRSSIIGSEVVIQGAGAVGRSAGAGIRSTGKIVNKGTQTT